MLLRRKKTSADDSGLFVKRPTHPKAARNIVFCCAAWTCKTASLSLDINNLSIVLERLFAPRSSPGLNPPLLQMSQREGWAVYLWLKVRLPFRVGNCN